MTTPITLRPTTPRIDFAALPPLALYVHIPWCLKKCPYCDFNSHEAKGDGPEQHYVDALVADLEQALPLVYGRSVHSIFVGGGTPSLFSPESLDRFLSAARALLPIEPDAEITLEANPNSVEVDRFADLDDNSRNADPPAIFILKTAAITAAPNNSNTIETVVEVGNPSELKVSSNTTSVIITARQMIIISEKENISG